ncbi:uncharacterized protein LOC131846619 isoform X3 [Achroia grisella]|uniref:uncharacterized protein LOC131846619 isoform X3 n=1 Tax=Achroia grisella TaxID=688607 RepID=UPI0027D254A1|nr:uncharacterized protein LOC131846619 isoform X3 [Achroia grisella]
MATKGESSTTEVKREVKVVKKQVKKEQKVENGEQNGDANIEADLTVKLPTKKSAAKTETKVEVNKTILPDGTVEEVKITTTKTTIDGKTEIKTKTEKRIIPKQETEDEIEEEEEEEVEEDQEEESNVVVQEVKETSNEEPKKVIKTVVKETPVVENGQKETIVKKEETSTTTTKKVVVVQKEESEEEEEEEEEIEESEPVIIKKPPTSKPVEEQEEEEEEEEIIEQSKVENKSESKVVEQEEEEEETVAVKIVKKEQTPQKPDVEEEDEEVEEEYEEAEDKEEKIEEKRVVEDKVFAKETKEVKEENEESEYTEEEYESEKEEVIKENPPKETTTTSKEDVKLEPKEEKSEIKTQIPEQLAAQLQQPSPQPEQPTSKPDQPEQKVPLREPSIPLDKVEEIEIKPIGASGDVISKSHTENTEIIKSFNQQPIGPVSTQTEYNRIENIVTVNRTTKTLDHSYELLTQQGVPTVKTYFAPNRERIETSPQPARPYQPAYVPDSTSERRHSLLLDRLSVERQIPSTDIYQNAYQYSNQTYDQQRQLSQGPQSEVINVSNVKPSKITNQQWYQQSHKENVLYNNVTPAAPYTQPWGQSQPQILVQPQSQPQPQYQPSYTETVIQDRSTNTYQQNYVPKPTNWASSNVDSLPSINTQSNQYSFLSKDSSDNYQTSTQQYSSSYVPPPWEQDSSYVADTSSQNYFQPPPLSNSYTVDAKPAWQPAPSNKFAKTAPTSYIPPAPNQSFVRHVNIGAEPPKIPGRKTYYSEYERRYITVPESTYIPGETKFQPQPDPSPQYYYDNNEPTQAVEHEWRKELREFTEKTTQVQDRQTTEISVQPPWEEDPKYGKTPSAYTPTPTWSQTLRPRSWRERSFESEYVGSQEFPKTNTLGRGRPLSSYGTNVEAAIPERPRGVSVDRYNPNIYNSPIPAEHPPVQTHTLVPTPSAKSYHNPNVPGYHTHARASAEPREHSAIPQARLWGEARGTPIQSRSFKYLQWITGTED